MATPQSVRNVIFDIGWVLVRLDYRPLIAFLQAHGAQLADRDAVMKGIRLEDHETGQLPGQGLLERLRGLTRRQTASLEETRAKWLDVFELEPAMIELAHRLSERYRVFLLSNIGDLHWVHLAREYRLHAIGHGALPSYVAGVMKPHPAIYAEAERRFALAPATTVFIDDRPDNVATATARGWHGILHQGYPQTVRCLQALGVG
jgi:FMN phosphatase YigB (HAD superfamily)